MLYHLRIDYEDLIKEVDGEVDWSKYVEVWTGLEWVLKNKEF